MKIAAAEALSDTQQPASFSLSRSAASRERPHAEIQPQVPDLLSYLSNGSLHGKVLGLDQLQSRNSGSTGGATTSQVKVAYWGMRVMAYARSLVFLVAAVGAYLYGEASSRRPGGPAGRSPRSRCVPSPPWLDGS